MRKKINIAIDGHSSCGKSTIAKAVAKELNYIYVDTGAMYRAISLFALQNNCIQDNQVSTEKLISNLDNVYVTFKYNTDSKNSETYLNGTNVEKEIRTLSVSRWVSPISEIAEVRTKLVKLQRRIAEFKGVVMDGRDIGTVVLPDAEIKFFVTADVEVRAKRRYDEMISKGQEVSLADVKSDITRRDNIDSSRTHSPLKKADGAVVLDNSRLTEEEQFQFIMKNVMMILKPEDVSSEHEEIAS